MKIFRVTLYLCFILLASCSQEVSYDWNIPLKINSIEDALNYVGSIPYKAKDGVFTPEELYHRDYGDCEDIALMLQYLFEEKLNIEAVYVAGVFNTSLPHAWVEVNGEVYEATAGMKISKEQRHMYVGTYAFPYPDSVLMVRRYGGFLAMDSYKY